MGRSNRSRYTILACLSYRPMSGYDVKQFLEGTIAHFWSESYGQIYPTLKELESDGLVVGRDDESDGRGRRVYMLTEMGLDALRGWLAEPPLPDVPRYELSLKLFFADQLPLDETRAHLRAHRARHEALLERYRSNEAEIRARFRDSPRLPFWLSVVRGGIRYAAMVVDWCDEQLEAFEALDAATYPAEPSAPIVDG